MTLMGLRVFRLAGLAMLTMAAPACAQDNLDRGKSAQQLFASDCAICHKSPQGLAKAGGLFGLQGFLREHYTASRETANLLARYIESAGAAPAADQKRQPQQRRTAKPSDTKPSDTKSSDTKPSDAKPSEAKPSEARTDSKPEPVKTEAKPEPKPEPKTEAKPESAPEPKANTEIKSGIAVTPAAADKPKSE
ncbi:hypothetical protein [Undibacter mobilis]|uniref:hypothetical protein n=1 Tax=Undibacter mobilis TaxID=2292256 RepID=UPI00143D48A8|nr:hypothetical protein [Undibacter mobilis]